MTLALKVGGIIGIIIGGVVFLSAAAFLVYFFILREKIYKKQLREIDRKFQYLHALLIGQDAQYVKRLELISRTNLLYVEIHTKYLKKFKEIRDRNDVNSQNALNTLRDLLDAKNFKDYKTSEIRVNEIIDEYDKEVNALNNELLRVVKPEEDCRQSSLTYKEQFRRLKQDYYSKETELLLMANSFEEVFKLIDSLFEEFETLVESAQYDEANAILPKIDGIIHELTQKIVLLPNLCTLVCGVIPDKISSVEITYRELLDQKYPLYHLCVVQTLNEIKELIKDFTHRIKLFDIDGIGDKLEQVVHQLDSFFVKFDEEKTARESFEENNENVYAKVNLVERKFIKLRNTIPEVSKVFTINETHTAKIDNIQNDINKVGALKRSLDTFIHSGTKQPYSLLMNKMNELSDASNSIISDIDEYNSYINSLKVDAEAAYEVVYSFYDKIRKAEQLVREINVQKVSEKYNPKFDTLFVLLNQLSDKLVRSPIDIECVNNLVHEVYEITNVILGEEGQINQDYKMMLLAENAIIYTNRHRYHFADIDALAIQAEAYFENGDFENAYITAGNALKKVKENNGR